MIHQKYTGVAESEEQFKNWHTQKINKEAQENI